MLNPTNVPFFPFGTQSIDGQTVVRHPMTDDEYVVNDGAMRILDLCNGVRTWGQIIRELAKSYRSDVKVIRQTAEPLVAWFVGEGMIWVRKFPMQAVVVKRPTFVLWNLTNQCNLRCSHCVVDSGRRYDDELSTAECLKLVDSLASYGLRLLVLSGGEPFLRRDLMDIVRRAHARGIDLQIATNGTRISRATARELATLGVHVQLSLDSPTGAIHDALRGRKGAWEKAVRTLKLLSSEGVQVMAAAVVTTLNGDKLPELYRFAAEAGAHTFRILPFVPGGRGSAHRSLEVSPEAMRDVTAQLLRLREEGPIPVAPMEFECTLQEIPFAGRAEPASRIGCDGAVSYCTICADGRVVPCSFLDAVKAENVRTRDFSWIWEHSRFLNYFRSLTVADLGKECRECGWLSSCRGSCIAANFTRGNPFQSNVHCWNVSGSKTEGSSSASRRGSGRGTWGQAS